MAKDDKKKRLHDLAKRNFEYVPVDYDEFTAKASNPEFAKRLSQDLLKLEQGGFIQKAPTYEVLVSAFGGTPEAPVTPDAPGGEPQAPVARTFPSPDALRQQVSQQPLPTVGVPDVPVTPTGLPKFQETPGEVSGGVSGGVPVTGGEGLAQGQFQITDTRGAEAIPPVASEMPQVAQVTPQATGSSGMPIESIQVQAQEQDSAPILPQEAYDRPLNYTGKFIGTILRDLPKYAFGEPLKGAANIMRYASQSLGIPQPDKVEDDWLYIAGQTINDASDYVMTQGLDVSLPKGHGSTKGVYSFSQDEMQKALAPQVATGLSQVLALVGTMGGSGATKAPEAINYLSKGAKYVTPAMQTIMTGAAKVFDKPAVMSSLQTASQMFDEANRAWDEANTMSKADYVNSKILNEGATKQEAEETYSLLKSRTRDEVAQSTLPLALLVAQTEKLPLEAMFKWIPENTYSRIINMGLTGGTGLVTESLQEGFQTGIENIGINQLYDKTRDTFAGLSDASQAGGGTGLVMGLFIGALKKRRANLKAKVDSGEITTEEAVKEAEEINKAEQFVNNKVDAFEASVAMNTPASKEMRESKEAQDFFDKNNPSQTNPLVVMPTEVETVLDKIADGIMISAEGLHGAYQWASEAVKATLENQAMSPAEKGATLNILSGMLTDIDKANTEGQDFIAGVEAGSVQGRVPAVRPGVKLPPGQEPGTPPAKPVTPSIDEAKKVREKQGGTNVLPSSGQTIVTPALTVEAPAIEATSEGSGDASGYGTIAADYLLTGGFDVMQSSDYLIQAFSGLFERTGGIVESIRNKYAKEIADSKLTDIKDFVNSDLYNKIISEIKDVVNKEYNNNPLVDEIFDDILKHPTGMPQRLGNEISSKIDKLETQATPAPEAGQVPGQVPGQETTETLTATETQAGQEAGKIPGQPEVQSPAIEVTTEAVNPNVKEQASVDNMVIASTAKDNKIEELTGVKPKSVGTRIGTSDETKGNYGYRGKDLLYEKQLEPGNKKNNEEAERIQVGIDENGNIVAGFSFAEWFKGNAFGERLQAATAYFNFGNAKNLKGITPEEIGRIYEEAVNEVFGKIKNTDDGWGGETYYIASDIENNKEAFANKVKEKFDALVDSKQTPQKAGGSPQVPQGQPGTVIQAKPESPAGEIQGQGEATPKQASVAPEATASPKAEAKPRETPKSKKPNAQEQRAQKRREAFAVGNRIPKDDNSGTMEVLEYSENPDDIEDWKVRTVMLDENGNRIEGTEKWHRTLPSEREIRRTQKPQAKPQEAPTATPANFPAKPSEATTKMFSEIENTDPKAQGKVVERLKTRNPRAYKVQQEFSGLMQEAQDKGFWNPETRTMTIGDNSVVLPTDAEAKAWLTDGGMKAVQEAQGKPTAKTVLDKINERLDQTKKKAKESTDKLNNSDSEGIILQSGMTPKQLLSIPRLAMKALGFGDAMIEKLTGRIQDAAAKSMRRAMKASNAAVGGAANFTQGLLKNIAKTTVGVDQTRRMQGGVRASAMEALEFYEKAVAIVGQNPAALQRIHQVMDPEVYEGKVTTGEIPRVELADLNPSERELYDLLRDTLDFIHQWHFDNGLITQETYDKYKGTYSPRFWEMETEADPELSAMYQQMGKSVNRKYIKERKALDDMMKDADDAIQDPVFGTAMRLAQTLRNEAVMNYANQVAQTDAVHKGTGTPPPGYILMEGKRYGALNGKYVARDIAEDFKGYFLTNEILNKQYQILRYIDALAPVQLAKATKTIYEATVFLGNILSSYTFAFMTGVDPLNMTAKLVDANRQIDEKSDNYKFLVKEGVMGTDILTDDLKTRSESVRALGLNLPPTASGRSMATVKGKLGGIMDMVKHWYGKVDDIAKLAAFEVLLDQGYSKEVAARKVFEGFQNYAQVGRYYDIASKTPVFGNRYIKFMADSQLRIRKNNITKRPLTYSAYLALMTMTATMISKLWGDEEEEATKAREAMPFKPKINLPSALERFGIYDVPFVAKTPYGEVNYARLLSPDYTYDIGDRGYMGDIELFSRYMPFQFKFKGEDSEEPIKFSPQANDIILGPWYQLLTNEDFRGKRIWDPDKKITTVSKLREYEQWLNAAEFLANAYVPYYGKVSAMYKATQEEPDYYGRMRTPQQALLNMIIKVQKMDNPEIIEAYEKDLDYLYEGMRGIEADQTQVWNSVDKDMEKLASKPNMTQAYLDKQYEINYERAMDKIAELEERKARKWQKYLEKYKLVEPLYGKK